MIACKGPTNTRVYTVAVYFRGQRLAHADGPSIQAAEMNAAKYALQDNSHLFPHLQHQKRIMERSFMNQGIVMKKIVWEEEVRTKRRQMGLDQIHNECSKRNDEKIRKRLELKRSQETLKEEPKTINEKDGYPEISNLEVPQHEPNHQKEGQKIELKKEEPHTPNREDYHDELNKNSFQFHQTTSVGKAEVVKSKQQHYQGKRKLQGYQTQSHCAFKGQYQGSGEKTKSYSRPTLNQRLSHNQQINRTSEDRDQYNFIRNVNNTHTQSSTITSPVSDDNHSTPKLQNTGERNPIQEKQCHVTEQETQHFTKETGNSQSGDGSKEEGELTDDDSETNANKSNVADFEGYAELISSPE